MAHHHHAAISDTVGKTQEIWHNGSPEIRNGTHTFPVHPAHSAGNL